MKIKVLRKKSLTPEEPEYRKKLREELDFLDKVGRIFLTGSQRFKVATDDSDIDYVVMKKDYDADIYPIIHGQDGIKEQDGSGTGRQDPTLHSSVKFEKYNFILTWEENQFIAWEEATRFMKKTFSPEQLKDKNKRIILFHDIKMAVFNFLENYGRGDT